MNFSEGRTEQAKEPPSRMNKENSDGDEPPNADSILRRNWFRRMEACWQEVFRTDGFRNVYGSDARGMRGASGVVCY